MLVVGVVFRASSASVVGSSLRFRFRKEVCLSWEGAGLSASTVVVVVVWLCSLARRSRMVSVGAMGWSMREVGVAWTGVTTAERGVAGVHGEGVAKEAGEEGEDVSEA